MENASARAPDLAVSTTVRREEEIRSYRSLGPRPDNPGVPVVDRQIGRIYAATIDLVAEAGYDRLTATAIARAAGVSKRTFYQHFTGKEACFLATYDLIVRRLARGVLAARHEQGNWPDRLAAGFAAFARQVAEHPRAARLALIDVFDAGPVAMERMRHTEGLFEALVLRSFRGSGDGMELSPMLGKAVVAACARVARARVLAGRESELPAQAAELMRWALSLRHARAGEFLPSPVAAVSCPRPVSARSATGLSVDPGELLDDERRMILHVVSRMAAEEGHASLSVARIRTAAGISRRRFDAHFNGVEDCFLAAVELIAGRSMAASRQAFHVADSWSEAVQSALGAVCARVAEDPILVRLCFFEVDVAGHEAARWRTDYISALAAWLHNGAPPRQRLSMLEAEASVGAGWALMHHYVRTGRAARLRELAPTLSFLVLAPVLGAGVAGAEIEAHDPPRTKAGGGTAATGRS